MDEREKQDREANPNERANFLSKITFFFACTTFRKGLRKNLTEEDIYQPVKNHKATLLGNQLEKEWKKQPQLSSWQLIKSLIKVFGVQYICLGLALLFIQTPLLMFKPILKGKIASYFTPNQTKLTLEQAYMYTGVLILITFTGTVFMHSYFFAIERLTLKVKIAICTLIYRKSLRLNSFFTSKIASGQAVTLITKDVNIFDFTLFLIHKLLVGTVQIIIMIYIMYAQIGVSALIGAGVMVAFIPIQMCLGTRIIKYRLKTAETTDNRVRITQEILTAIRIIKMYTWELFFSKAVRKLRIREIKNLRIIFYIRAIAVSIGQLNARFALYICIISYVAFGNYITAEKAFVVTGCFAALRVVLTIFIPIGITQLSELKTALYRIVNFLQLEEVKENGNIDIINEKQQPAVIIKNVTSRTDNNDAILEDVNLKINNSGLTLITGSVGSGKSTLLKLILGDMKKSEGVMEISGKMSYASQEPWLFPGTARQNIIFNEVYDQRRYEEVVKVCALEKDFHDLPKGDKTCLTDRGLNLSRGQKTRINLARAIYKIADIYLLDDCLSAVDPHVSKHIFYECIKGFLKNKMCLLVTHQQRLFEDADNIVILSQGSVKFQGSYDNLKEWNKEDFKALIEKQDIKKDEDENEKMKELDQVANNNENVDETSKLLNDAHPPKKHIYEEITQEGEVKKDVYMSYFRFGGGVKMVLLIIILSIAAQGVSSWSDYFVTYWVDMEQEMSGFKLNQTTNSTEFKELEDAHDFVMKQYSFVIFGATILVLFRAIIFYMFSSRASMNLHNSIMDKIINAGMTFFDDNLSGNIINRFSRDLGVLDEHLPNTVFEIIRVTSMLFGILFVISTVNTIFLIPSAFFLLLLYFARRLYLPTGRGIRRLEGATRSPVIGQFNATLEGLTTIRASEAQTKLTHEFEKHLDIYNSAVFMHLATSRAFGFYLDATCDLYVTLITLSFLVFDNNTLAGRVGLAITQAFSLTGLLQWCVRQWAELENQMTSAERVLEYAKVEAEDKDGQGISNWPHSGKIVYTDVNLRYSPTNERVLKDVNFTIYAKQKIGIVGRTGAGKTSIISTLFRLYDFRGTITIDDIDTKGLPVELLRSKLSIIPQDPVLFTGTIRANLDPNSEFSDKQLWDALGEVEMKNLITDLSMQIREGGSNFSVGQRQLICLARAIIRNNKVLILDEATANIDPQTDAFIQRTIREKFSDCTVITIAHKLNTIMDSDRILVMDSGRILEHDHPQVLLANRSSIFYKMVHEAGLL
ncbi:hypothetical protein ILUMI_24865 [Ignelater luminosus]|uniref:Multidrug resistance-associated protein lethal(2)03659 n=1 Tax=Ignelater luminosus TaxID=2038154 RepID=A0A8K0G0K4_IGNLU|nr:hypothetical protein ILUMI_24865 [Ignelater luminosus]